MHFRSWRVSRQMEDSICWRYNSIRRSAAVCFCLKSLEECVQPWFFLSFSAATVNFEYPWGIFDVSVRKIWRDHFCHAFSRRIFESFYFSILIIRDYDLNYESGQSWDGWSGRIDSRADILSINEYFRKTNPSISSRSYRSQEKVTISTLLQAQKFGVHNTATTRGIFDILRVIFFRTQRVSQPATSFVCWNGRQNINAEYYAIIILQPVQPSNHRVQFKIHSYHINQPIVSSFFYQLDCCTD